MTIQISSRLELDRTADKRPFRPLSGPNSASRSCRPNQGTGPEPTLIKVLRPAPECLAEYAIGVGATPAFR